MTDTAEQLRRLKNTIMGASHRLSRLAGTAELGQQAASLREIAAELNASVERLERLLTSVRRGR